MHQIQKVNDVNFFKKLASWVSQYCLNEENIIIVGDFNSSYVAKN